MKIATIIVTYKNSPKDLEGIEKSLLANGIAKNDIYFSDNTKENLGYGGGINRILRKILKQYDYFFIVNPDVIVHKNCVNLLHETLKKNPKVGIVGPKILDEKGNIWSIGGELDKKRYSGGLIGYGEKNGLTFLTTKVIPVDFISGTAMLIRKEVFEKVGLFVENYFLYYEDVDFCLRARKAGWEMAVSPQAAITHFASSTIGKNSPMQQYYMGRNHLYIAEAYGSFYVKLHELFRLPKTIYSARKKRYELLGIRDYLLRRKGQYDYWS